MHKQIEVIINSNPQITRHNEKAYTFGDLYLLSSPHRYAGAILAFILFMEGSSTRIQLNPALQPKRGYVNLPGIGSVNAEVATNSLGIQDVIDVFDSDGEFYNNDKFYNRLKGMK